MTETWLDTAMVAGLTGDCTRTVRLRAANRDYVFRQQRLGRRGRPQLQIALSSLSADAQMKYARLQLTAAQAHALVPADPAQPTLFASPVEIDMRAWADVPDDKKDEAKRRLNAITPMIEWNAGHRLPYTLRDGSAVRTSEDLARYVAEQYAISRTSAWAWYSAFKKEGVIGLVRSKRSDASRSRFFESHAEAAKFVLAKYQELGQCSPTGSPNLMLIYDELVREYPRMYPQEKDRRPSPGTVRNFLAGLPPCVRDAARLTRQAHDAKYSPFVLTNIAALKVNEYWVCDHRVLDILSFNDCFATAPQWRLLRVWVTAIEDMRSRVVWCTCTDSPSWRSIASALRIGMARFGRPRVFYCDNGKDFKKVGGAYARAAESLNDDGQVLAGKITENLLARLGVRPQYCIPKHPRSKMIESFFATVSKRFDVMFGAGYAGAKPSLRPDQCREAEKRHHLWMEGKANETPFLPASHLVELVQAWTEEYNTFHAHSGHGMDGRAPYDVMRELLPQPELVDVAAIEPLFWAHEPRIVSSCTVQINKQTYEGAGDHDAAAMYAANGTEITLAYDPDNLDRALAIANGQVIARLQRQQRLDRGLSGERSPQTEAEIARIQRMGRANYKAAMRFWQFATEGVPTMLDGLRERAGLPAPRPMDSPKLLQASLSDEQLSSPAAPYVDDVVARMRAASGRKA